MSDTTRQRITGIACAFSACAGVFCISRMLPYGLAGDVGKVKLWFVFAIILLAVSIACGLAYYFYGNRAKHKTIEHLHTEIDILTQAGRKPVHPTAAYSELDRPKESNKQK